MADLVIPDLCLVALVGVSGSGKSSFAAAQFLPTQVLSSDYFRGLVSDDANDQGATRDAFDVLHYVAAKRLAAGRLTVVDATNVQADARRAVVETARAHDLLPVAIVLDVPEAVARERNAHRADRAFGLHVVRRQSEQLRKSMRSLQREGFRIVHVLRSVEDVEAARVVTEPLRSDRRNEHGPFDLVGDVHGCLAELAELLERLDYSVVRDEAGRLVDAVPPPGRRAVFVGDLVDRGPDTTGVLRLVMGMVSAGHALCVPGNHEAKLVRALRGRNVSTSHGLALSLQQLDQEPEEFRAQVLRFCDDLVAHLVLDDGNLVVAHAGLKEEYHNRASGRVRAFALYGDTDGETDEYGLPVRYPWAEEYRGRAAVVYGHTPTTAPTWINNTLCIDTGCVFGGALTALRYPERDLVAVDAREVWFEPVRPLAPLVPDRDPRVLDLEDVTGRRVVETAHHGRVTIGADQAAGALEVMSRWAIAPADLPYLPPTMSPADSSALPDLLEHPAEAFGYYARNGVDAVVCEEKHMGSRAVVRVRRGGEGAVYTRTGRSFFDPAANGALVSRVSADLEAVGLFEQLGADWVLLDAELMPWSAKAIDLVKQQYASVAAAASSALSAAQAALATAAANGRDVAALAARTRARTDDAHSFAQVFRRYCWPTDGIDGISLAPFQVLASDGATYETHDHLWHLGWADALVAHDPGLFASTGRLVVETSSSASQEAGVAWWNDLTATGGEGMVVKPLANLTRGTKGLVQPAIKVRGREYLRLVYGPDYTEQPNLLRLRERNLSKKRSLAAREYALGLEAVRRAAAAEPLWRVHECVFAVLALESEPVDPRL